jgi:hypothetical protein
MTKKALEMESDRETQKKYGSRALVTAIIVGLLFIIAGQKPIGKGLILGTIFSVINFVLIGETIPMILRKSRSRTYFISFGSILIRYSLMALPLILAIRLQQFNLLAVIIGIFMIQIVIGADYLLKIISPTLEK